MAAIVTFGSYTKATTYEYADKKGRADNDPAFCLAIVVFAVTRCVVAL
jgi:hypothetical protein